MSPCYFLLYTPHVQIPCRESQPSRMKCPLRKNFQAMFLNHHLTAYRKLHEIGFPPLLQSPGLMWQNHKVQRTGKGRCVRQGFWWIPAGGSVPVRCGHGLTITVLFNSTVIIVHWLDLLPIKWRAIFSSPANAVVFKLLGKKSWTLPKGETQ